MWDSINAYVNAGVEGGLITFVLFLCLFATGYRTLGIARALSAGNEKDERLIWAIGSTLFANTVAFVGITYFDQSVMAWYALLAMISVSRTFAATEVERRDRWTRESEANGAAGWKLLPEDCPPSWAFHRTKVATVQEGSLPYIGRDSVYRSVGMGERGNFRKVTDTDAGVERR
jgi:hypothetical protein